MWINHQRIGIKDIPSHGLVIRHALNSRVLLAHAFDISVSSSCIGNVLLKAHSGMLLLPGLIYNACWLELASILMLENVNRLQYFETYLHLIITMLTNLNSPAL